MIAALCVVAVLVVWFAMRESAPATEPARSREEPTAVAVETTADAGEATAPAAPIDAGGRGDPGLAATSADAGAAVTPVDAADAAGAKGGDPLAKLSAALADGRYADGLAACGTITVSTDAGMVCTRLACKQRDAAAARLWIARAAKIDRGVLEAECKRDGTDLRPKVVRPPGSTKVDPCKADPMACQH